ncbi:hypothetical protein MHU86_3041 [Fragilaria crotonensis]|nr:hypothetical protein MHU86_3041 [Fragilaria crotonensis]
MRFNYLACLCHEYGDDDDDCCSDDNAHIDLKEARKDETLLYFICRLTETAVEDYYPSSSPSRGFFLAPFTIPSFTVFDTPEPTNEPTNEPSPQQQQQPHEPSSFEYITPNPVPPADDTSVPSNAPTIRWMPWGPIPLPTTEPSEAPSFPPSIALSTSPSIVTSTQPSPTPSITKSRSPSIAASNVPSSPPTTSIPSIATSTTPSIPPSILPSVTSSTPSITFGPSAIPTTTTTTSTSPEPSTPSPSPSTSEVESRMRIALRKTQEWSVAYRMEIVQALTLLQGSLRQRLQQQSWRRWLQRRRQQQESTDTNRQTAQIVNETTVSCPSSITLTHECRDVTIRVSVPNGTSIEDASIAINDAIEDGYLQRLIAEINPDSTTTVLGVVPSETGPSTNAPTLSPSPSKQPPEKGDGTITPTTTSTTNNDTANSDPFISGASDPGGMSSVAIGALVVLGTAVFLIGCAIVVRMVRHSYRQKQDREAAPPTIIHARRGASFSEDDNDEMMNLNDGDVELGRDVSEDSRARRRRHEKLQQRAIKYRSVSSGSDSFIDPLDPYLYSTSAHEMYPWHNNGKTTDTETTSESTPLYVDSSIHASPYEENIYDGRMALGVAVGIIAEDRFEQFEDTGDPLDTSYMERNDDAPKELVLASETAQFHPDHSDGSDLSTDSADIWAERKMSSPEQLIQASETAQFDPTADHSREILPKGLAAAIAVSNGMASDANSDTSTDSSSDEESSSSAGDSTSSSSSSGSSSTEDLATGITNYDPKTAEVAIASATMIGVVVGLSRSEDERYNSDDEWDTSETNAIAVSSSGAPNATLITTNATNSFNASASHGIPDSTRSSQQEPMVELLPAVAAAYVPAMASFSDSESSYNEGQTSDDEESVADIIVPSNIDAASPVTDVNAINTMYVLRPDDLPREQGIRESKAIGVGDASVSETAAEVENFMSSEIQISSPDRDTSMSGERGLDGGMMLLAAPVVAGTYFSGDASSRGASEGDISNVTTDRNPLPGAVVAAGGISGGAVSSLAIMKCRQLLPRHLLHQPP